MIMEILKYNIIPVVYFNKRETLSKFFHFAEFIFNSKAEFRIYNLWKGESQMRNRKNYFSLSQILEPQLK